jgi:hypothetical protein
MQQLTAVLMAAIAIGSAGIVRAADRHALEDRLDIEQVWSRYAQALDTANPEAYSSLFTSDAYLEVDGTVYRGRDQIRALIKDIRKNLDIDSLPATAAGKKFGPMRHISSGFILDLHGSTATSESYWTEVITNGRNEQGVGLPPSLHRMGRYEDTFVKQQGKWLLSKRIITGDLMMPKPTALEMPTPR